MKRHSDGFSLVEVIIAIAVLAVVAMSLLAYFSSANRYTNWGKTTQKADMAAQSVVEELASCTTFDQIQNGLVASGSGVWGVITPSDPSDSSCYLKRKDIFVDGTKYKARVKVDFDSYKSVSGGDPTTTPQSKFNDYDVPQLKKVYSEKNVVLEETDQTEIALGDLFYQAYKDDTSITKKEIWKKLNRKMCIRIEPYKENELSESSSTIYLVKGYYEYYYDYDEDGDKYKYKSEQPIRDVKIPVDSMESIYLFCRPINATDTKETLEVSTNPGISASDFSYYVIRQDEIPKWIAEMVKPSPTPTLPLPVCQLEVTSGSGSPPDSDKVYTNMSGSDSSDKLVKHEQENRIAMITVEIYYAGEEEDGEDFKEEDRIVMVQTSKGA